MNGKIEFGGGCYQMYYEEFDTSELAWIIYKLLYGVDLVIDDSKERTKTILNFIRIKLI